MKALLFITLAVICLSMAMGITVFNRHPTSQSRLLASFNLDYNTMKDWFCGGEKNAADCIKGMSFTQMRKDGLLRVVQTLHEVFADDAKFPVLPAPLNKIKGTKRPTTIAEASKLIAPIHEAHTEDKQYPYFGFLPLVDAVLIPGAAPMNYTTPCFSSVTAQALQRNATHVDVVITTSGHKGLLCIDSMLIMGGDAISIGEIGGDEKSTYSLDVSNIVSDPAKLWMLNNRGILVARMADGWVSAVTDLISTVTMLIGFAEPTIKGATFVANTEFVQNYVEFNTSRMGATLRLRDQDWTGKFVAEQIDPSYIESGDVFIIIRPDGLDPMIAWAEGGSAGHTTMAMRAPNGTLYVCESTTHDAYWPTNGIQCHEWSLWVQLAHAAQYNVVMLPMAPEYKAQFNVTKAWDFFYENEGLNYGFLVLLSGWLDMKHGDQNSPCVPPDFTKCFTRPLMERVVVLIDEFMGNNRENLVRQMFSHRVGLWPQEVTLPESIMHGQETLGFTTLSDLYSVVEQDSWVYNTTRYGKNVTGRSMVCNVFVCNMLKHAGVFSSINSDLQCGESNLWTLYSSNIWDATKMGDNRPQVCKDADPTNPLCQMMGNWTMHLHPDLNSRPLYPNMSNHCPSMGPNYYYPDNC